MTYQNMKIEINDEQPLNEVVKELEWLGYVKIFGGDGANCKTIETYRDGTFDAWVQTDDYNTTLQQLREMK